MAEPPILPEEHQPAPFSGPPIEGELLVNPYAIPASEAAATQFAGIESVARTELTLAFWLTLIAIMISFCVLIVAGYPPAWLGPLVLLPAAIRVPLVQRKLSRLNPRRTLPNPVAMLFTSLVFVAVFGAACSVAFVAICIPTTIVFSDLNSQAIYITTTISALAALAMFVLLYIGSLRFPV